MGQACGLACSQKPSSFQAVRLAQAPARAPLHKILILTDSSPIGKSVNRILLLQINRFANPRELGQVLFGRFYAFQRTGDPNRLAAFGRGWWRGAVFGEDSAAGGMLAPFGTPDMM